MTREEALIAQLEQAHERNAALCVAGKDLANKLAWACERNNRLTAQNAALLEILDAARSWARGESAQGAADLYDVTMNFERLETGL